MAMAARELTAAGRAAARQKRLGTRTPGGKGFETFRYFDDLWGDAMDMASCGVNLTIEVLNFEGEWVPVHTIQMSEAIAEGTDPFSARAREREKAEARGKIAAAFGLSLEDLARDDSPIRP